MPSGRRASSASAPSSTGTPATSEAESFPPSSGDPSRSVTLTSSSLRKNAAASPPIPPPRPATSGVVPVVMVHKPAIAASAPEPDVAVRAAWGRQRACTEVGDGCAPKIVRDLAPILGSESRTIIRPCRHEMPRGQPKGLKVPLSVEQRVDDREARLGGLAVEVAAHDLDRPHSDRFGADAEAGMVVDHDGVRGRDTELLQGGDIDLRGRLGGPDLAGQDHRVRERD